MFINKNKTQHISSVTHESKVIVFVTDSDGNISYIVKQDGFEDSYLNTPVEIRNGWEKWQNLEFPNETDDVSVMEKEKAENTYQSDTAKFVLKSRYNTQNETAVAPVQLVSAQGCLYMFRQSKANTLLVDRFVFDSMTNKLNRKLEVRFKRSKQKFTPIKSMRKTANGLVNVDSLDFRDANGNFFYEATTELNTINNLNNGWFSVVIVPTIESDVYRWHIFAYNSQTLKVELTTLRASEEGLFELKDYTVFEPSNDVLVPRKIPGIIKRTLDIANANVTNGLAATKYDIQQEQETQSGDKQLLKMATRLMLAIPTDKGVAAFSFAIAADGTLAQIDDSAENTYVRNKQREILLPLNTLDEIKAFSDTTPPPQGVIEGLGLATENDGDDAEDLVKITTSLAAAGLANGDQVKIAGNNDYQGLYKAKLIDSNTFEVNLSVTEGLGYWEKQVEEGGLVFDGLITAYEKTADGNLRIICPSHGLSNGDEVQVAGTESYNDTFPVQKIDDNHFVIERKWPLAEAINVKLVSRRRLGVVLDGNGDYIETPLKDLNGNEITIEYWFKGNSLQSAVRQQKDNDFIIAGWQGLHILSNDGAINGIEIGAAAIDGNWHHVAMTWKRNTANGFTSYLDGAIIAQRKSADVALPKIDTNVFLGSAFGTLEFTQGQLADVRIWQVARTGEDIRNNMYLPLSGKELGLVAYWRLGAIAEGKVIDFSVNGYDGTVHGDVYVSAATLNRKLSSGAEAVKYANSELFAVSRRSLYEESFEFKVNAATPVNLAFLDNSDGKNIGSKIFTLNYWGKTSRSADEEIAITAVQNKFEDLGNGWFKVSCNVTIPDSISLLRSFELTNVKGVWNSLEIRKHKIRLLSDNIMEAKFTDTVSLTTLADNQASLTEKLQNIDVGEVKERLLVKEKKELDAKIAAYNALAETRAKVENLKATIETLTNEEKTLSSAYETEKNNPFNFYQKIFYVTTSQVLSVFCRGNGTPDASPAVICRDYNNSDQLWQIIPRHAGAVNIKGKESGKLLEAPNNLDGVCLWIYSDTGSDKQLWKLIPVSGIDGYAVQNQYSKMYLVPQGEISAKNTMVIICDNQRLKSYHWRFESTSIRCNNNEANLLSALDKKRSELNLKKAELKLLERSLTATPDDKAAWDDRLKQVLKDITDIQTEINSLNTGFINAVKTTQQPAQTMLQVAKDGKGLVTQAALLGFAQSASRLQVLETCEGNVQLSYFDKQGRMRQTLYDACADSNNATFEQWLPNAQRVCLNLSSSGVNLAKSVYLNPDWTIEAWFVYPFPETSWNTLAVCANVGTHTVVKDGKQLGIYLNTFYDSGFNLAQLSLGWHHLTVVGQGDTTRFYIDGKLVGDVKAKAEADAQAALNKNPSDATLKQSLADIKKQTFKVVGKIDRIGGNMCDGQPFGKLAEVRIWAMALTFEEIEVNSKTVLSGNEPGLLTYYPMNEATGTDVRDQSGNGYNGTLTSGVWWACAAPIGKLETTQNALISVEYSTIVLDAFSRKSAIMRRLFAYPVNDGVMLLPDKRVETLEQKWIGNAQFAPTLLGYIEGAPPVPSENLTYSDDYNGATSVELTMSEDVSYSWFRSQDSGLGANAEIFAGSDAEADAGFGFSTKVAKVRAGFKGNIDFSYQFQNESNISSSSSENMVDKLELRGTAEEKPNFPHLGNRFVPKNVGYALVVSALADVFVVRLARSGKMVGYQVQPIEGIPPDVNTITFMMNPAYTMNGSLDGMTGSSAASQRFFKHVPEMRMQYGSLYPASYYRLQEAYDLKEQIQAADTRSASYFSNFNVHTVDETSLNRNIDSGNAPAEIGVKREEDKPNTEMTQAEKDKAAADKAKNAQAEGEANVKNNNAATEQKRNEINAKINDREKSEHAQFCFAGWQKRMEDLQIRAGKRNIVNTYVWDADGGFRAEMQSFASTVEHTIGGSFTLNAGLGFEGKFAGGGAGVELTAQATINLTQTMNKTQAKSTGLALNVDLSGLEFRGITNYKDEPILPGEKVDRYRFMSFYLDGSTSHFQDFFNYVVDPEWLKSNDEEARALRQAQAGKPNKPWRVLHRVTYVERPALMGVGVDVRKLPNADESSEHQQLLNEMATLKANEKKLETKLDQILAVLKKG